MSSYRTNKLRALVDSFQRGEIDRRRFIESSLSLGIGVSLANFFANSATAIAAGKPMRNGFAFYQGQDGTPSPSPSDVFHIPNDGMESVTRGEGGELKILQWQAPTTAAIHTINGDKSAYVSDIVLEPLMRYTPASEIFPYLVTEVPSVENGLLAEDLTSATFKIKDGIRWSDGEPFTAKDVQFTWEWITTESNNSIHIIVWSPIKNIEVVDDLTAHVTYHSPNLNWFDPFTGGSLGAIYPGHIFDWDPANRNEAFETAPIGTGPFKIDSFQPNEQVILSMNDLYWQENAPYFSSIIIKGGGDEVSAARAVLQTGEFDYAPMLQVEPDILDAMLKSDPLGSVMSAPGMSIEGVWMNFSDPHTEVDGQRSEKNTPHPFFSDIEVRRALNVAIDRALIAEKFYGEGGSATRNILNGIEAANSPNTSWTFDLEEAAAILDGAGWVLEDGVRTKDGVKIEILYATTVNQVRQKTQAVIKDALGSIGINVNLEQIDAGIFFDSGVGNDQNTHHMYWDMATWTGGGHGALPVEFMGEWYAGPDGSNIAQRSNDWKGHNSLRYNNPEYDAVFEKLKEATDLELAYDLFIQLNDMLIDDVGGIPLVNRASTVFAISNDLNTDNLAIGTIEMNYWNIANWNRN